MVRRPKPSKHVVWPHATRSLTRKEIEDRVWREAKLKFLDCNLANVPPSPTPVEVSGIYILMSHYQGICPMDVQRAR